MATQCGPTGMPMLTVSGPTSAYRDGTPITLRIGATMPDGRVGAGQVTVTTDVGVVMEEGLTLDEFGTASFTFACNVTTNPDCVVNEANLRLRWTTTPPVTITHTVRLTARPMVADGGGMGGGAAGMCISDMYSRAACTGSTQPGLRVRCCLTDPSATPSCGQTYACNGKRITRSYFGDRDGGGLPTEYELEFRIPTYRAATYAECMRQQVGYVLRRNGVEVPAGVLTTYGTIDATGQYFGLRIDSMGGTLRPREDRECSYVADAGTAGIWHSVDDVITIGATNYYPIPPGRIFFQSDLIP